MSDRWNVTFTCTGAVVDFVQQQLRVEFELEPCDITRAVSDDHEVLSPEETPASARVYLLGYMIDAAQRPAVERRLRQLEEQKLVREIAFD